MNIEIRKLTPDLVEDYVTFFDTTPHNEKYKIKCYCIYWRNDDHKGKRDYSIQGVKGSHIQGYIAYYDGKAVEWCNANTKSDCLKCLGWGLINRKRKGYIPTEDANSEINIKSIFCFVIAPKMRRQGIASLLLARVCQDAAEDGFDFVEVYPDKEITDKSEDHMGYADMYKKMGFTVYHETNRKLVMRKPLK
jgi:GNAT superfamily N-acetyltransferase